MFSNTFYGSGGFSTLVSLDIQYTRKHNVPPNVNIPKRIRIIIYVINSEFYNF